MDREEAIELIVDLNGEEYNWVDFKRDYHVLGANIKRTEFIEDVAAMANTLTDKKSHYIIVGVDDNSGELVGVSDNFDDTSGVSHILALDDAKIQNAIVDYISPTPKVTLHKFVSEDPKFGILEINPIKKKPCVIDKAIESGGNTYLQKGVIYLRKGSRNTIARRSGIESFINDRVQQRREEILDGITRAVEIGPEAVASIGEVVYEEEGDLTIDIGEDADFVLEERISRESVSDLDSQLNQDISQWAGYENVLIGRGELWNYYSSPKEISIDEQAVAFLSQASIKNRVYGVFWLTHVSIKQIREILYSTSYSHDNNERVLKVFATIGDEEGLEKASDRNIGNELYSKLQETVDKNPDQRIRELTERRIHDIGYREWSERIDLYDLGEDEIRTLIPELSEYLNIIQSKMTGMDSWYDKRVEFQKALCDLEIVLGARYFD